MSIRIALLSNDEAFFHTVPGVFIYFQNPELLGNITVRNYLDADLLEHESMNFSFFEPIDGTLQSIRNKTELSSAITRLSRQRKQYVNNVELQGLLTAIETKFRNERVHILWITDEDSIEKVTDANFFDFSLNVLSSGNTTFSYLGYGEVPNWITMNTGLMNHNGNSYYVPMYDKTFYQQQDLIINYVKDSEITDDQNPYVFCDTIIQNIPLIIQEIANLANRYHNYLTSIQLVKVQKNLLHEVNSI